MTTERNLVQEAARSLCMVPGGMDLYANSLRDALVQVQNTKPKTVMVEGRAMGLDEAVDFLTHRISLFGGKQ